MSSITKILIVEDDAIIAQLIELHLTQFGYKVIDIIHNGDKALDAIHNHDLDMVLLDINIEGTKNGIDVATVIEKKYDIPYIFITALSDQRTLSKILNLDPSGYIVKPFKEEDLRVNIGLALASHKKRSKGHTITLDKVNEISLSPLSQK